MNRLPDARRRLAGSRAYHSGIAAEEIVAEDYARRGFPATRRRWRGPGGEIDLIVKDGDGLIFVEVKHAETHAIAASRLSSRQIDRIAASATSYLECMPRGQLTDYRIDLATVDRFGRVAILENASQF